MHKEKAFSIRFSGQVRWPARLAPHLLGATQITWLVLSLFLVVVFSVGTLLRYSDMRQPCIESVEVCFQTLRLRPVNLQGLASPEDALRFYASFYTTEQVLIRVIVWVFAGLIFWKRRDHWLALLVAFWLLTAGPAFAEFTAAQRWPWLFGPITAIRLIGQLTATLFFFVFPNGRFEPRWMRWPAGIFLFVDATMVLLPQISTALNQTSWAGLLLVAKYGFIFYSQIYRFRKASNLVERQQIKLAFYGIALSAIILLGNRLWIGAEWDPDAQISTSFYLQVLAFAVHFVIIPITLGVAILRYRLFDIDLVFNRTLVFGALTIFVAGTYALVVSGLNFLIGTQGLNFLASVIAASMIALLFLPLFNSLQRAVNRLIYGERDEPYQVLSRLGQRLESAIDLASALTQTVDTVARAIKLPYAAIMVRQAGEYFPAATYGSPQTPLVRFPLIYAGDTIGEFLAGQRAGNEPLSAADRRLLSDLARQVSVAAHAALLDTELQAARLRIVEAREETRRRLGSDLHDGVGHQLVGLARKTEMAVNMLEHDPVSALKTLTEINQQLNAAITQVRSLAHQLHPPELEVLGLVDALREQTQVHPSLTIRLDAPNSLPELPTAVETAAYYIALEALTNIEKHASASSCQIRLSIATPATSRLPVLEMEITDNGAGLQNQSSEGLGLLSMQGRAIEVGGTCQIFANPSGGTTVQVSLPIHPIFPGDHQWNRFVS